MRTLDLAAVLVAAIVSCQRQPAALSTAGPIVAERGTTRVLGATQNWATEGKAAWAPDHTTLLLVRSNNHQPVLVRVEGEHTQETPVRLPPTNADLDVMWNWSFSPDSKWLCLRRIASSKYYWPHGATQETVEAEKSLNWSGIVNLDGDVVVAQPLSTPGRPSYLTEVVGWHDGSCLLAVESGNLFDLTELAPQEGASLKVVQPQIGAVRSVSPNGRFLLTYTGFDGNIRYELLDIESGKAVTVLDDPFHEFGGGSRGGTAHIAFSPDSSRAAIVHGTLRSNEWTWRVAVRPLPWGNPSYEQEYKTKRRVLPRPAWSPTADRFVYWREQATGNAEELVGVDISFWGANEEKLERSSEVTDQRGFPPVWSPDGSRVAWLAGTTAWVLEWTREDAVKLGEFTSPTDSWSWAAPVSVSFAAGR